MDSFLRAAGKRENRQRSAERKERLYFDATACLPVRFPEQACGLCVSACPVGTIELSDAAPDFQEGCIGCGQCTAVCPTGAPSVDGFALPAALPAALPRGSESVQVDCWRVPFAESPPGALRVPCLAGIGAGWLLVLFDLAAAQGERTILLLDRGACAECAAGSGMAALHAVLGEVRELLADCGVADERLPRFAALPSQSQLAPTIPTSAGEIRIERRHFFRGLMGGVARGVDEIAAVRATTGTGGAPNVLRDRVAPLEHMRTVTALTSIAARHGRAVSSRVLPMASLADCDAHGVCAKVCPTGALVREESGETAELRFLAARCIACGQCARNCPDKALHISAAGGSAIVEVLARWRARQCTTCGEAFFGAGESCPDCSKHQQLFQGMTALLQPSA